MISTQISDSRHDEGSTTESNRSTMENKSEKITVNKEELRKRLTPLQYQVTQEAGTERPFTGLLQKINCQYYKEDDTVFKHDSLCLLQGVTTSTTRRGCTSVSSVIRTCLARTPNTIRVVVGQRSMMSSTREKSRCIAMPVYQVC